MLLIFLDNQATGGCRPIEAKRAMIKIAKRLRQTLKYPITFQDFEIQNILAVYDVGVSISLSHFVHMYDGHAYYEPDIFPAVRIRIRIPNSYDREENSQIAQPEVTPDEFNEDSQLNLKFRKIILSDSQSESQTFSDKVGGYMISESAKRPQVRIRAKRSAKLETVNTNVFSTGKITFTGAKSIRSLSYALRRIRLVIEQPRLEPLLAKDGIFAHSVAVVDPRLQARLDELQESESFGDYFV